MLFNWLRFNSGLCSNNVHDQNHFNYLIPTAAFVSFILDYINHLTIRLILTGLMVLIELWLTRTQASYGSGVFAQLGWRTCRVLTSCNTLEEIAFLSPSSGTVRPALALDLIPGTVRILKCHAFAATIGRLKYSHVTSLAYIHLQLDILLLSHLCSRRDCTSPSDMTTRRPSCRPFLTTLIPLTGTCTGKTWISSTTTGLTPFRVSAERPFTALIILPLSVKIKYIVDERRLQVKFNQIIK